jgi:L-ribulokinase
MWHKDFGGLPDKRFLEKLHPDLGILRDRLYKETVPVDVAAGPISAEWADRLGLPHSVIIGSGAFDAHLGAVGGEIKPGVLVKVMGTSTCDMIIAPLTEAKEKLVAGICGQIEGSIVPGMLGLEAGQSAFGDVYAWFSNLLMWPLHNILKELPGLDPVLTDRIISETENAMIAELSRKAGSVRIEESSVLALDWLNGRRTPDANQELKGLIAGLTLGSDAPAVFRALVEATAFGARAINERFIAEGVKIDSVIAIGGVAKKNPFVMQIVSDVLKMPIKVARSEQTCALGSAMAASVAAGIHKNISEAQKAMGSGFEEEFFPNKDASEKYDKLFEKYLALGLFVENNL